MQSSLLNTCTCIVYYVHVDISLLNLVVVHLYTDGVPYDGVPRKELVTIHPALTALVSVLVAVGLVLSVVCLVFNIVFRKKK